MDSGRLTQLPLRERLRKESIFDVPAPSGRTLLLSSSSCSGLTICIVLAIACKRPHKIVDCCRCQSERNRRTAGDSDSEAEAARVVIAVLQVNQIDPLERASERAKSSSSLDTAVVVWFVLFVLQLSSLSFPYLRNLLLPLKKPIVRSDNRTLTISIIHSSDPHATTGRAATMSDETIASEFKHLPKAGAVNAQLNSNLTQQYLRELIFPSLLLSSFSDSTARIGSLTSCWRLDLDTLWLLVLPTLRDPTRRVTKRSLFQIHH